MGEGRGAVGRIKIHAKRYEKKQNKMCSEDEVKKNTQSNESIKLKSPQTANRKKHCSTIALGCA